MARVVPISLPDSSFQAVTAATTAGKAADLESVASSSIHSDDEISDDGENTTSIEGSQQHHNNRNNNNNNNKMKRTKNGQQQQQCDEQKSNFLETRNRLRDQVLKEVMEAVMPDIGAYDIDGMANRVVKSEEGKLSKFLKYVGLKQLDLHEAVLSGSAKHVRRAIRSITVGKNAQPALVNQYDELGRTALSLAVKIRSMEIVDILLDNDALPDIIDEDTGRTPIFFSISQRAYTMTQTLLSYKASADMPDFNCVTPLMLAASLADLQHVKILLQQQQQNQSVEVDAQDENGWTPLHYAANANAVSCLQLLMREGANRHLRDLRKRRALDIARFRNHGECIALLEASKLQW